MKVRVTTQVVGPWHYHELELHCSVVIYHMSALSLIDHFVVFPSEINVIIIFTPAKYAMVSFMCECISD